MGSNYVEAMCDKFVEDDRMWKNFANELPTVSKFTRSISNGVTAN